MVELIKKCEGGREIIVRIKGFIFGKLIKGK